MDNRCFWAKRTKAFFDAISGFLSLTGAGVIVKNLFENKVMNFDHVFIGMVLLVIAVALYWATSWALSVMSAGCED
jgi:hypothetical protein